MEVTRTHLNQKLLLRPVSDLPAVAHTNVLPFQHDSITPSPSPERASPVGQFAIGKGFTIPAFDLEAIQALDPQRRRQAVQAFGEAFKEYGFIAIKANKQDPMLEAVYVASEKYFNQKAEEKEKDVHGNGGQTGYTPMGGENAAGSKKVDAKELWFIPPNFEKWPESVPEFKESVGDCHQAMWSYCQDVWELLREHLVLNFRLKNDELPEKLEGTGNLLRLAHYLSGYPDCTWAAAHLDLNLITALPRPSCKGLQMWYKGAWVPVDVPEGYVIINGGDQLAKLTAGYFTPTLHRVQNPGDGSERYAAIFFGSLDDEVRLDAHPTFMQHALNGKTEEEQARIMANFPSCNVAEARLARLSETGLLIPNRETFEDLWKRGLIKYPSPQARDLYPDIIAVN